MEETIIDFYQHFLSRRKIFRSSKVDNDIAHRAPGPLIFTVLAVAFNHYQLERIFVFPVSLQTYLVLFFLEAFEPFRLDIFSNLVLKLYSPGLGSVRVLEREGPMKANKFKQL